MPVVRKIMEWFRGPQPTNFVKIPLPLKGSLFVSPMPFGPYDPYNDVIREYRENKVHFVVMLVTDDEIERKNKKKYGILDVYAKHKVEVLRLPFQDLSAPPYERLTEFIPKIVAELEQGQKVAIHCNAGVGRTGIIAACISAQVLGISGAEAVDHVRKEMMVNLIDEQKRIINRWADEIQDTTNTKESAIE